MDLRLRLRGELVALDTCPECLASLGALGRCPLCGHDCTTEQPVPATPARLRSFTCLPVLASCYICGAVWSLAHTPNPCTCPQCGARE